MKTIYTLVKDIYSVVEGNGGWDETVHQYFLERSDATLRGRVMAEKEERPNTLRMSNIGKPCARALWYHVNNDGLTHSPEALPAKAQLKFLYGDILEDLLLALAKAAGHRVEGEQDVMRVGDIVGHRDCVIDGVLIDVKSASTWSFKNKFACNGLKDGPEADGFGYIRQLSSYLLASKDDPLVTEKSKAGFLVIDKTTGDICLDMYDLSSEVAEGEKFIQDRVALMDKPRPPDREFRDMPHQKSGNRKLGITCSYCEHKKNCWPNVRTFVDYTGRPTHLTVVKREPKMTEIKT